MSSLLIQSMSRALPSKNYSSKIEGCSQSHCSMISSTDALQNDPIMWYLSSILISGGLGNWARREIVNDHCCFFCALTACLSRWWHSTFQLSYKTTVVFSTATLAWLMRIQIQDGCLNLRTCTHICPRSWLLTNKLTRLNLQVNLQARSIKLETSSLMKNLLKKLKTLSSRLWMKT